MKKLISIGVVLAILALAVVPVGVAAQPPAGCPDSNYTYPQTFAKIPFAILESGVKMLVDVLGVLPSSLGIPSYLPTILTVVGPWLGGPLSWTVDMLGWGLSMVATILNSLGATLGLPAWLPSVVNTLVCGLFTPYTCVTGNNLTLNCTS